ncbi:MAG: MBL fold metallo-hydrolase [Myxococcales bacterium]
MRGALTLLGSGDAFNAGGRGHSCYLVEDALGACAVDFGATALGALKRCGKRPAALASVLVTHLHGDHFAGLPFLFIEGLYREPRGPLVIGGPPGVEERVRALASACYHDIFGEPLPFELRFVEWEAGREVEVAGRRVLPLPAHHQDLPERAFSLRLSSGGATLAFSGDTGWSDRLPELVAGAELVIAECSLWDEGYDRHLGRADWERLLPALRGRRVVAAHLGEEALAHRRDLAALAAAAGVELILGEDGLRVEL